MNSYSVCVACVVRYFNYLWLGFPMKMFPKAVAALTELLQFPSAGELLARPDLSHQLRRAIDFMQSSGQNELEIKGHNLVYLHVNYNTFRLAFWALSNLLETPAAVDALQRELEDLLETHYDPATNTAVLDAKDVENLKVLGMRLTLVICTSFFPFRLSSVIPLTPFPIPCHFPVTPFPFPSSHASEGRGRH